MILDGIGGHRAGEVASKLGANIIKETVIRNLKSKKNEMIGEYNQNFSREANILNDSLLMANKAIYDASHAKAEYRGMGTTVASLLVGEKTIVIAHVGDSRIYLIRNQSIERLTEDHSLVMEQLRRGTISEEEAEKSDMKNIITRALGADKSVNPTIDELIHFKDDIFLICSDGLTDLVSDEEILDIVWENRNVLDHACQVLIDKANERGGKDNITTILVNIENKSNRMLRWFSSILKRF